MNNHSIYKYVLGFSKKAPIILKKSMMIYPIFVSRNMSVTIPSAEKNVFVQYSLSHIWKSLLKAWNVKEHCQKLKSNINILQILSDVRTKTINYDIRAQRKWLIFRKIDASNNYCCNCLNHSKYIYCANWLLARLRILQLKQLQKGGLPFAPGEAWLTRYYWFNCK